MYYSKLFLICHFRITGEMLSSFLKAYCKCAFCFPFSLTVLFYINQKAQIAHCIALCRYYICPKLGHHGITILITKCYDSCFDIFQASILLIFLIVPIMLTAVTRVSPIDQAVMKGSLQLLESVHRIE